MPIYDFRCACGHTMQDTFASFAERTLPCPACGGAAVRQFPFQAARAIQTDFEPYYDEALGCDVHSRQEKRAILQALNLIEAGDAHRGAQPYDPSLPPTSRLEKQPLQGKPFQPRVEKEADFVLTVQKQDGREREYLWSDLPAPKPVDQDAARKAFDIIR